MKKDVQAKVDVLKELLEVAKDEMRGRNRKGMEDMMGQKMQKVAVMAPDEEGLKEGLEKAEEIVESKMEDEEGYEEEDGDMEGAEGEELDDEAKKELIKKMMMKK